MLCSEFRPTARHHRKIQIPALKDETIRRTCVQRESRVRVRDRCTWHTTAAAT